VVTISGMISMPNFIKYYKLFQKLLVETARQAGHLISLPFFFFFLKSNVVVEWLTLLLRVCEVPGSNLGSKTGYSWQDFHGFTQSLQAKSGMVP
jgi:hypothetical protein